MLTPEPEGSAAIEIVDERSQEENYEDGAWIRANRAHQMLVADRHLAVRREDWAGEATGEALFTRTLRILR